VSPNTHKYRARQRTVIARLNRARARKAHSRRVGIDRSIDHRDPQGLKETCANRRQDLEKTREKRERTDGIVHIPQGRRAETRESQVSRRSFVIYASPADFTPPFPPCVSHLRRAASARDGRRRSLGIFVPKIARLIRERQRTPEIRVTWATWSAVKLAVQRVARKKELVSLSKYRCFEGIPCVLDFSDRPLRFHRSLCLLCVQATSPHRLSGLRRTVREGTREKRQASIRSSSRSERATVASSLFSVSTLRFARSSAGCEFRARASRSRRLLVGFSKSEADWWVGGNRPVAAPLGVASGQNPRPSVRPSDPLAAIFRPPGMGSVPKSVGDPPLVPRAVSSTNGPAKIRPSTREREFHLSFG